MENTYNVNVVIVKQCCRTASIFLPKLSDFLLDLHQSLAHQGLAKSLDISIGMPTLFANLATSRSWHISSQKIAQLRF